MSNHTTADIRNIALIGGSGTGKTSLGEAILHTAGEIERLGNIGDGTTVSDFDEEEKAKTHSVRCSVLHADHKGIHYSLLDTPGYPDFVGEAASGMGGAEAAALHVSVTQNLTFPGHKIWDLAGKAERTRCVVLTHIDQADPETDLSLFIEELGESLGARCVLVSVPDSVGESFSSVSLVPLGGKAEGDLAALQESLTEAIVEIDDEAMTRFLEEDSPPSGAEAEALLNRSMKAGELVPVLCVNPLTGAGVPELLDLAKRVFPSPLDGPFYKTTEGEAVSPEAEGTSAFVFKTVIDPYVGKLCILRVVSGQITAGDHLKLARTGKSVKLGHLEVVQGKDHKEVHEAVAGDIVAVTKIDDLETSDTLSDPAHERVLADLIVPKPMASRSIEALDHGDELKLSTGLRRAVSESPAFHYERNDDTGELVVHGTSIMHIESELKRLKERSGVEVKIGIPRVALQETINAKSDGHHRHKKQTGGRGQFAEVFLTVEPGERGQGLEFVDATVGGSVPKQFIPAIEKGVRAVMSTGIIAGYPVVDVTVKVKDGKYHDVDSDEASFKLAGGRAFKDGFTKANPVLLEPLVDMEIAVPSRFMGAITSDVTGRRGQISGMDSIGDMQIVRTRVPQREVLTYPTILHSLTSGEGSFTAEFADYEVVPSNIQQALMAEYKPKDDD
jgi:elongation factor G